MGMSCPIIVTSTPTCNSSMTTRSVNMVQTPKLTQSDESSVDPLPSGSPIADSSLMASTPRSWIDQESESRTQDDKNQIEQRITEDDKMLHTFSKWIHNLLISRLGHFLISLLHVP